jgi:hypothetical protein
MQRSPLHPTTIKQGAAVLFGLLSASASAQVVDLDASPNLKGIFDGGLRPWLVYRMESQECEIRPGAEASFKIGGLRAC